MTNYVETLINLILRVYFYCAIISFILHMIRNCFNTETETEKTAKKIKSMDFKHVYID